MTDIIKTYPASAHRMPERASWPAPTRRDYGPSPFADPRELDWGPTYGPHICASCWGAGWAVNRDGEPETNAAYGQLIKCGACNRVDSVNAERFQRELGELWVLCGMNPSRTDAPSFANYATDDATRPLYDAITAYANRPRGWLTLYGSPGSGKTHLAEALTRHFLASKIRCVYMTAPALWEWCGAVERSKNDQTDYEGRRKRIADMDVLIIDDLGTERDRDSIREYRFSILDTRYRRAFENAGRTVLISNDAPNNWSDYRLAERAMDTRFVQVQVQATSYRRMAR